MAENKLSDIIKTSLDNISTMGNANTVVGEPINTPNGTIIIPVSKLMIGIASGGVDYKGKHAVPEDKSLNFGGGGGTGLTVSPVAFLVISPEGDVEMLNINNPVPKDPVSSIVSLIENSPELISRIKGIFSKDKAIEEDEDFGDTIEEE